MDYTAIGARIRRARKMKDLTQYEMAKIIGISLSFYGHIERGSRIMSIETLGKVCESLDVDAHYLLWGASKHSERMDLSEAERHVVKGFLDKIADELNA